jgi:hypothetical protein
MIVARIGPEIANKYGSRISAFARKSFVEKLADNKKRLVNRSKMLKRQGDFFDTAHF